MSSSAGSSDRDAQVAASIPDKELDRWERETGEHRDAYPLSPDEYLTPGVVEFGQEANRPGDATNAPGHDAEVGASMPDKRSAMNDHELHAWRVLVEMGATLTELGGKPALDITSVRPQSAKAVSAFVDAVLNAAGRSGVNRRHVDRAGHAVFVVSDDPEAAINVARWQRVVECASRG